MNFDLYANYLFGLGAIVWVVSAFNRKRTLRRVRDGNRRLLLLLIILSVSLTFSGNHWHSEMQTQIFPKTLYTGMAGLLLTASGILFAIWARFNLGTNWSGVVTLKEDHELITTGAYSITRNPIYTGFIVAIAGKAIIAGDVRHFLFLAIISLALLFKINTEEKLLSEHFGDAFTEYKRTTKKLIPFIY